MRPVPVLFHLGPLQVHTYGIGLAVTFWFAYRYFERRLRRNGYPTEWLVGMFLWVIVAAVVGARVVHVLANLSYYVHSPHQVIEVWHGGLSSFGGLIFGIPTALVVIRRRCPELAVGRALDLVAPVLVAAWCVGRLLGPQLMVAGGGHPTTQWFGMYYADQVGKRLPVPIFQALEDLAVFLVLLYVERRCERRGAGHPAGTVLGVAMILWGIVRTVDEHLWLSTSGHIGDVLVQVGGVVLVAAGAAVLGASRRRWRGWSPLPDATPDQGTPGTGGATGIGGAGGPAPPATTAHFPAGAGR